MNRRNFIKNSMASSAILNLKIESKPNLKIKPIMMATDWGFKGNLEEFCSAAKAEGYDGIEVWWSAHKNQPEKLFDALQKHSLSVGFLVSGNGPDFKKHVEEFKSNLDGATDQNFQEPLYINCHSGRDYFSTEQNQEIIEYTLKKAAETGIEITHETHRGRMCYSAPLTRDFLIKNTEMTLTLDISHWTNVHESLLEDQPENVKLALERTRHIHLRVGHQEGPQVNDPRAPEWKEVLQHHLNWWDTVVENRIKAGAQSVTFLSEFGPPNYLPTLPYTKQPVANQWDINVHMMKLIRNRYS
ncbi:MAG: sugar phosphate isomerase/epimerase [Cytophagales bacterium]|nr:sugar phosphate isomerase/epimerase [Cytophagales bacterium]